MYCKKCKKEYPKGSKFCGTCGAPLVGMLDVYGERFFLGDMEAFDFIYADTYSWVSTEVRKIIGVNTPEIDDCVQEIYLLLYRKIRQYNPQKGSFSAWFNILVRNRIYDYGRKISGKKEFVPEEEDVYFSEMVDENIYINPEAKMEKSEREQILDEIMQEISESQRLCIQLYYCEGMKIKEIAEQLNISEGTVKSRLHNGLKKLNVKVTDMQRQGLYTFTMVPLAFFLWIISRDDCSAKGDYLALQKAEKFMAHNALQHAENMAATKGVKNIVDSSSKVAGTMAGKTSGMVVKTTVLKFLVGGITAAIIGTGGFYGRKLIKNYQKNKETTQTSNKENKRDAADTTDTSKSTKKKAKNFVEQFVNNNENFVKEMLALEVNAKTPIQNNKEKNFMDIIDVSMMIMYDNLGDGEIGSEIWNVVSKDKVVKYDYDEDGGSISVQEDVFEKMKQFVGCDVDIENLSKKYGKDDELLGKISYENKKIISQGLYPNAGDMETVNILLKKVLDNGDVEIFFTQDAYGTPEQICSTVISASDNELGAQINNIEVKLKGDMINKILGVASVLGKQYTEDGRKINGSISQISNVNKMTALIDSVYWRCVMSRSEFVQDTGLFFTVFSEDAVEEIGDDYMTLKKDAFDDYLNFVSYNGTIDDIKNYLGEDQDYGCEVNIDGDRITFSFNEDGDIPYSLDGMEDEVKQGLRMDEQENLILNCKLFEIEGAGDECVMTMEHSGNSTWNLKSFTRN